MAKIIKYKLNVKQKSSFFFNFFKGKTLICCLLDCYMDFVRRASVKWNLLLASDSTRRRPSNRIPFHPLPSTLFPRPSSLDPLPSTLDPLPLTLDPQPSTT